MSQKRTALALAIGLVILLVLMTAVFFACDKKDTTYTVTFYVDGEVYQTVNTQDGTVTLPTPPTKEGYTFGGWYVDNTTFRTAFTASGVKTNVSVYAKWIAPGDPSGEEPTSTTDLAISGLTATGYVFEATLPNAVDGLDLANAATVDAGATFAVYSDSSCTASVDKALTFAEGDNTFYVKVTALGGSSRVYTLSIYRKHLYTLTFDTGTAATVNPLKVEEGATATVPNVALQREGYTFDGWDYDFTQPVTASATVTAEWTIKTYTLTFVTGTDLVIPAMQVNHGALVTPDYTTISRKGYTFDGWDYDFTQPVTASATVTAQWTVNRYTLTFDTGIDATVDPITVDYGTVVDAPAALERVGYDFTGWSYDFTKPVEADTVVTAGWAGKTYDLTFENDVHAPIKVTFGEPMPAISYDPYKQGNLFDGMGVGGVKYYNADFTSAHVWDIDRNDVVMQELWVAGGYYVWLQPENGDEDYKVALTYGANYALDVPAKTGYDFAGWYSNDTQMTDAEGNSLAPSAVSDSSWTFVAHYTAHVITVKFDSNGSNTSASPTTVTYDSTDYSFAPITRTGYVFGGWYLGDVQYASKVGAPMRQWQLDEETTLTAKWTPVVVTVNYDSNGSVDASFTREATFAAALPTLTVVPTRTGYEFYGYWTAATLNEGTCIYGADLAARADSSTFTDDVTLYAQWQPVQETVTLRLDDESAALGTATATYGELLPALDFAMPTKDGYVFTGFWSNGIKYFNADGTGALTSTFTTAINLYAQWKNGVYFVKFAPNGATSGTMSDQEIECDVTEALSTNLYARAGYSFTGWNTASDGKGTAYANAAEVKDLAANGGTITLYAQWTANGYAVTFGANGGEGTQAAVQATYDAAMPAIVVGVSRTGYSFVGYFYNDVKYYNADGSSAKTWDVADNTLLVAKWQANTTTVSFDANGGEGTQAAVQATYDAAMPAIVVGVSRTGYTFAGYYDQAEGGTQYYAASGQSSVEWDKAAAEATLYAHWTANTYTVTFHFNGATTDGTDRATVTYGEAMPAVAYLPSRTGYTFLGYFDAAVDGTQYYNGDGSSANAWDKAMGTTLYAHWQIITATVTFDAAGGTGTQASVTATYGQAMPDLAEITVDRQYYRLDGWYSAPNGQGSQFYNGSGVSTGTVWNNDVTTLYAYWIDGYYTVHYNANCESCYGGMSDKSVRCNQSFNLNTLNFSRTGYTFVEWNTEADGTGTSYTNGAEITVNLADDGETATLYAIWQGNSRTATVYVYYDEYDLTFDLNYENPEIEAPATQHITPATGIEYVRPAVREGYYFAGWYRDPECTNYFRAYNTIYQDTTVYAKWVERTNDNYNYATYISRDGTYDITLTYEYQYYVFYTTGDATVTVTAGKNAEIYISSGNRYYGSNTQYVYNQRAYRIELRAYSNSEEYLGATTFTVSGLNPAADGRAAANSFSQSVTFGSPVALDVPVAEGYTFGGWYSGDSGSGTQYVDGEGNAVDTWDYDYNHAIYAYWIGNDYTVALNDNGGEGGLTEVAVVFGQQMPVLDTLPTRTDFDFVGYTIAQSSGSEYYYNSLGGAYSGRLWNFKNGKTLYAQWTKAPYTVVFDGNGATGGSMSNQTHYRNGSTVLATLGFTKVGYTFAGWNTKADGSGLAFTDRQTVEVNLAEAHGEATLYAQWTPGTYKVTPAYNLDVEHTVTFDLNGAEGDVPEAQVVTCADGLVLPEVSRDGYDFLGWYDNPACTGAAYSMVTTHTEDVTLYARWEENFYTGEEPLLAFGDTIDITYDDPGASYTTPSKLVAFIAPYDVKVTIYTTGGPYDDYGFLLDSTKASLAQNDQGGSNGHFKIVYTVSGGNLYYIGASPYYTGMATMTVTLHLEVETIEGAYHTSLALEQSNVTYDADFTVEVPVLTGYVFQGWYDDVNGQGTQYTDETGASVRKWDKAENATLYAYWQIGTYAITFDANGGTGTQAGVEVTYGDDMPAVTVGISRANYEFLGYFDAAEGGTKYYNADGTSAHAMDKGAATTLYAHWAGLPYTVAFDANGGEGSMDNQVIHYAAATALTANAFTKTGYDFAGWATAADGSKVYDDEEEVTNITTVGNTITLYAKWTAKTVTVTKNGTYIHPVTVSFNLNGATGEAPATQTVTKWNALTYPAIPTRTNHLFAGWYDNAECTGDAFDFATDISDKGTVTLYARWIEYIDESTPVEGINIADGSTVGVGQYYGKVTFDGAVPVTLNDTEMRLFPVVVYTTQTVVFTTYNTGFDTYGVFYDADLKRLTHNDDGRQGAYSNAFYISYELQANTLYYIGVRAYSSGTTTVSLDVIGGGVMPADGALSGYVELGTTTLTYDGSSAIAADSLVGYTFDGWYDGVGGTGTKYVNADGTSAKNWDKAVATTLYAKWTAKTHTVTFDANGGVGSTPAVTATYGSAMPAISVIPTYPYKIITGYFDAAVDGKKYYNADLSSACEYDVDDDLTLYAQWEYVPYYAAFNANGGTGEMATQRLDRDIPTALTASTFTKTGYDFMGWNTKADGSGESYADGGSVINIADAYETVTLYAVWKAKTTHVLLEDGKNNPVSVSFNLNGASGVAPATQVVTGDVGLEYPDLIPTRDGYLFAGWYSEPECENRYDFDDPVYEPTTLYARWFEQSGNLIVMGQDNDITVTTSNVRYYFYALKAGYYAVTIGKDAYGVNSLNYYGNGTINMYFYEGVAWIDVHSKNNSDDAEYVGDTTINVEFLKPDDGGTSYYHVFDEFDINYDDDVSFAISSLTNYDFMGWYTSTGGGGTQVTDETGAGTTWSYTDATKTLYAYFRGVQSTVTFDKQGGTGGADSVVRYYDTYSGMDSDKAPTRTGYTFQGYYDEVGGAGNRYYYASMSASRTYDKLVDTTLYAYWTVNEYEVVLDDIDVSSVTVSFNLNGASGEAPASQVIAGETALSYPAVPTRSGYMFAGWYDNPACTGTSFDFASELKTLSSTITLYAKWIAIPATIGGKSISGAVSVGDTWYVTMSGTTVEYFVFVPLRDTNYTMYADSGVLDGAHDSHGYLFDADFNSLDNNDDGNGNRDFKIDYTLVAGQVYVLGVAGHSGDASATIPVVLEVVEGAATPADGATHDSSAKASLNIAYDDDTFALPVPVKAGYTFGGWYDGEGGTGTQYTDETGAAVIAWDKAADTTLYAKWIEA